MEFFRKHKKAIISVLLVCVGLWFLGASLITMIFMMR